jgi:hypothetical protein
MEDNQHDVATIDDASAPRAEDSASQEGAATTVARLLANPRRIRRN